MAVGEGACAIHFLLFARIFLMSFRGALSLLVSSSSVHIEATHRGYGLVVDFHISLWHACHRCERWKSLDLADDSVACILRRHVPGKRMCPEEEMNAAHGRVAFPDKPSRHAMRVEDLLRRCVELLWAQSEAGHLGLADCIWEDFVEMVRLVGIGPFVAFIVCTRVQFPRYPSRYSENMLADSRRSKPRLVDMFYWLGALLVCWLFSSEQVHRTVIEALLDLLAEIDFAVSRANHEPRACKVVHVEILGSVSVVHCLGEELYEHA